MKLTFKIAITELRTLIYSPIAWLLTIAFFMQCAQLYTSALNASAITQETGGIGLTYMSRLTSHIFTSQSGVFTSVIQTLYLYIPLLTMGLISREVSGGTISLLYSSPIKIREIVFGKYLAMLIYSAVLMVIIILFIIAGIFNIKQSDSGMLWSAAFGFFLLLCAYSAIGLFMSSLTSYQVVAAVSTFIMIGALTYVGKLWQGVAFIRDLTYFLSIAGRTQHMLTGLITTNDVLYFIIIVYIFLGLSIIKLQSGREMRSWVMLALRYVILVGVGLAVGYIGSRPGFVGYWDTTVDNGNTLAPSAQKIVDQMNEGPLEVTVYSNFLDDYYYLGLPERRNDFLARWELYRRFKSDINFNFVSYYDTPYGLYYNLATYYNGKSMMQVVAQRAKTSGVKVSTLTTPDELHKTVDLKPEMNRFVMKLTYQGKSTYLRIFNDILVWPSEAEVSAAFKRLLQAKMPKIIFVTGDRERSIGGKSDREYRTLTSDKTSRYALVNQGFDVDTLSLDKSDIPENTMALVIADPQQPLSQVTTEKIEAYIAKGGNLLIAGEPGRQQILNPVLSKLGVQISDGLLEQGKSEFAPTLVLPHLTKSAVSLSHNLSISSIDTLPVSMSGVAFLSYHDTAGFRTTPLLVTKAGTTFNTMGRNPDLDIAQNYQMLNNSPFHPNTNRGRMPPLMSMPGGRPVSTVLNNPANGPKMNRGIMPPSMLAPGLPTGTSQSFTTAIALTRQINGKQQRIIVCSDADFLGNQELKRFYPKCSNFYFGTALFSWLDYGLFPVDTSRPDSQDNRVIVTMDRVEFLKLLYSWILPGLLLILGSFVLIRRRRK
jgi:ABC-2 type transport system permease protein